MKGTLYGVDSCYWSMLLISIVQAVPVSRNETEIREGILARPPLDSQVCLYGGESFLEGQTRPSVNPCETCSCFPPNFSCSLRICDVKPGCKALQSAGRCCPEYVCDCQKNGRTYGNGEKVEEPNPCNVCYCRGGEIKCAGVTCYTRDDCEPHYVPGKCCPKYDHCLDIRDKLPVLSTEKTDTTTTVPTTKESLIDIIRTSKDKTENEKQQPSTEVKPNQVGTLEIIEIYPDQPQISVDQKENIPTTPQTHPLTLKNEKPTEEVKTTETWKLVETTTESTIEKVFTDSEKSTESTTEIEKDLVTVSEIETEKNFTEALVLGDVSKEQEKITVTTSKDEFEKPTTFTIIVKDISPVTEKVSDNFDEGITEKYYAPDEISPEMESGPEIPESSFTEKELLTILSSPSTITLLSESTVPATEIITASTENLTSDCQNCTESSTDVLLERLDEDIDLLDSTPNESSISKFIYRTEKYNETDFGVTENYFTESPSSTISVSINDEVSEIFTSSTTDFTKSESQSHTLIIDSKNFTESSIGSTEAITESFLNTSTEEVFEQSGEDQSNEPMTTEKELINTDKIIENLGLESTEKINETGNASKEEIIGGVEFLANLSKVVHKELNEGIEKIPESSSEIFEESSTTSQELTTDFKEEEIGGAEGSLIANSSKIVNQEAIEKIPESFSETYEESSTQSQELTTDAAITTSVSSENLIGIFEELNITSESGSKPLFNEQTTGNYPEISSELSSQEESTTNIIINDTTPETIEIPENLTELSSDTPDFNEEKSLLQKVPTTEKSTNIIIVTPIFTDNLAETTTETTAIAENVTVLSSDTPDFNEEKSPLQKVPITEKSTNKTPIFTDNMAETTTETMAIAANVTVLSSDTPDFNEEKPQFQKIQTTEISTNRTPILIENVTVTSLEKKESTNETIPVKVSENVTETSLKNNSKLYDETPTKQIDAQTEMTSELPKIDSNSTVKKIDNSTATLAEILLKWLQSKKAKFEAKNNKTIESPRTVHNLDEKKIEAPVSVLSALTNELLKIVKEKESMNENVSIELRNGESRSLDFDGLKPTDSLEIYSSDIANLAEVLSKDGIVEIPNPEIFDEIDTPIHLKYPFSDESLSPVLSMISDQLQFLRVGEEQPIYVNMPVEADKSNLHHRHSVLITPTSIPITVNMVKVVDGVSVDHSRESNENK